MRYRVLGSVTATVDGEPAALGGPKARALLALLLVDAGRVVTDRRLIAGIWGDDAPDGAHHAIQNHVSRLRRAIDDEIVRDGGGYRLDVDPMAVDAHRFVALAAAGRDRLADAPAAAATLLRDALALWHGEPYADLDDVPGLRADVRRLDAARLEAVEDRMQADLDSGRHADVVAELEGLIREHPFRERLYGMYMLALYRAGRQADALDVFHRAREALADELGIDPSPELAELHSGILTHDPALQIDQSGATAADSVGTETTTGSLPVVGGFELREHVGEGDFGRTYRAYHAALGREVALKILRDELSDLPDVVREFDRRAQRVAQLDHPHVMPLLDYWRDPGAAYLVTPWAPAGGVHDALRHGPWTPTAALRMLEQVGAALELAHRRGVVHGDVKTTNIILSGDGDARLTDFPVARRLRDAHGTPRTNDLGAIAPEERRGAPCSIAGDVYSVGAVAIEVLTGAKPATEQPATVLAQRADVPDEIVEAVAAATAADPAQRPARVVDMLRRLRRALGADVVAPAGVSDDTLAAVRNPYKGLHAFTEDDAVDFFGRESVVNRLLQAVGAHRLVAVVGPSGSGKSSIVRAGAIPALRAGALRGSERWLITGMYPGSHPFDELSVALRRVAVDPPDNLVAALTVDDRGLARLVKQILPGDDAQLLLLVIDQFEELFSLTSEPAVRQLFLDSLVALADDARGRVRTIVTLRADFFDRPLEHHGLGELLRDGLVSAPVPSRDDLAQAVSAPARQVGVEFEPGLIGRIVSDVVDQPGGLPLMQYALTELFTRRSGRTLTERAYEDTGGVRGALGRRAEELYTALSSTHQDLARQIFLRLVTVDEHAGETRRRARRSELIGLSDDRSAVDEVLQRFGAHRLVTFDRDPVTRGSTVEVAHEALLTEWGRLRRWIDDRRDDLLQHRRLTLDAAEWRGADRADDFLLAGGRLEQLARFAEATDLALDRDEREFLAASQEHDAAVQRHRQRQRRLVTVALAAVALLTAVLVGFGLMQRGQETVRAQMEQAAALAAASRSVQTADADLALLLAREAVQTTRAAGQPPTSDALGALHEAVLAHRVVATIDTDTPAVAFLDDERLITPSSDDRGPTVWNVASGAAERTFDRVDIEPAGGEPEFTLSLDGRRYAEAYEGDTPTTVWDVATGEVVQRMSPRFDARAWPVFDETGAVVVVYDERFDGPDEALVVYDVATGDERHHVSIPGNIARYAVSPDGRVLAVPRADAPLVHMFDLETGEQLPDLQGRSDWYTTGPVAFHPDGDTLAVLYQEGRLRLYDLQSRTIVGSAHIDTDTAVGLCYSADGSTLAVTSESRGVDILTGDADTSLTRITEAAISSWPASCTPDGTAVAAATVTGRAKVWDVTPAATSEVWSAATPAPWTAAWVGDALVTMHDDRRLRRYEPGQGLTATSGVATLGVEYPPPFATYADRMVATFPRVEREDDDDAPGFNDGVVLRNARALEIMRRTPLTGHPQDFDRDGARLLVSKQASVHVLETASSTPIGTLDAPYSGSSNPIAAFLSDGRHAVVDDAYKTYIFDLDTGDILATVCVQAVGYRVVTSRKGSLFAVDGERGVEVYDADRLLDAAADAGPVRLTEQSPAFECANGNPAADARIAFLEGIDVRFMAFNPDGTRLATVSENGNVSLWDPRTGELQFTIPHEGEVGGGTFSNEGRHLAVTVDDPDRDADTVRIYTLDLDELLEIADAKVTRELTAEECAGYRIADPCGPAT